MKLVLGGLAAVAALALAGVAYSAYHLSIAGSTRAFGGGRLGPGCTEPAVSPPLCTDHARYVSLDVHHGRGQLLYGLKDEAAAGGFRGRVTCMRTDGSRAVLGGVIRRPATTPPMFFLFHLVDNAPPGVPARDRVSLLHVFDREHPDAPVPAAFPFVCPSSMTSPDGYLPLEGDVAVHGG
jgi:hypothetical protein